MCRRGRQSSRETRRADGPAARNRTRVLFINRSTEASDELRPDAAEVVMNVRATVTTTTVRRHPDDDTLTSSNGNDFYPVFVFFNYLHYVSKESTKKKTPNPTRFVSAGRVKSGDCNVGGRGWSMTKIVTRNPGKSFF